MKRLVFSGVRSTSENLNVFITRDEKCYVITENSKFSFYFIVYTTMRASDVITNVTKTKHERHGVDVQLALNM